MCVVSVLRRHDKCGVCEVDIGVRRVSSERVSNAPKRWRRVHAVVESAHAPCVSFTGRAAAAADAGAELQTLECRPQTT